MQYVNLTAVGEDTHEVLRQLLLAVHGFNAPCAADDRIAIAFPAMLDAIVDERGKVVQLPRCGAQLRLFGPAQKLEAFLSSPLPSRAIKLGMAVRSALASVPAHAGAIRYVRDRRFERTHPKGAYARRQKLRAQQAGREYHPNQKRPVPENFSFPLRSKSSGLSFHLDVRREPATTTVNLGGITAYGLCGPNSAVPFF